MLFLETSKHRNIALIPLEFRGVGMERLVCPSLGEKNYKAAMTDTLQERAHVMDVLNQTIKCFS